ncbi:MAG: serine/threonine-protein kinase [Planctomycetota bacterium]
MSASEPLPDLPPPPPDWEAFYRDYRKPGYVPGFEITTKLGGGTFGLVFRARRLSIGKDYAIKFLHVEDGAVRAAIARELEQVPWFAQIDHPNLVAIEDRGEVDGIPYLVMAFAGTETLRDKLVVGQVPTGEAKDELLRIFLQCCRGAAALHDRSLVHFDIKPANVFLKGSVARLGDYGLSKLVTQSRGSLSMGRGTPYYMAPELLQRRGDHRSDVYSLGVMLYEILCGALPFRGDSEWEVLRQHETATPVWPAHLSGKEQAILARCLQKDPAARFPSVLDLIEACGNGGAARGAAATPAMGAVLGAMPGSASPDAEAGAPATTGAKAVAPAAAGSRRNPPRAARPARAFGLVLWIAAGLVLFALRTGLGPEARFGGHFVPPAFVEAAADLDAPAPDAATAQGRGRSGNGRRRGGARVATDSPFERFLQVASRDVRTAGQREQRREVSALDLEAFGVARDAAACAAQLRQLLRSPQLVEAQLERYEALGRPAFLGAVAELATFDYDDPADCRCATRALQVLGRFVGSTQLEVVSSGSAPSESETCRYQATADAWRQLAERFARDEASYRAMRVEVGRQPGGDAAVEGPR